MFRDISLSTIFRYLHLDPRMDPSYVKYSQPIDTETTHLHRASNKYFMKSEHTIPKKRLFCIRNAFLYKKTIFQYRDCLLQDCFIASTDQSRGILSFPIGYFSKAVLHDTIVWVTVRELLSVIFELRVYIIIVWFLWCRSRIGLEWIQLNIMEAHDKLQSRIISAA